MTWNLRKPNVRLNVRPVREWDAREKSDVIAGLTPEARQIHRSRRARECAKVEPLYTDEHVHDWVHAGFRQESCYCGATLAVSGVRRVSSGEDWA
jgi:hypothetical protein